MRAKARVRARVGLRVRVRVRSGLGLGIGLGLEMTQAERVMKDRNMAKFIRAPSPSGSTRSAAVRQVNMTSLGANFWPTNSSTWLR